MITRFYFLLYDLIFTLPLAYLHFLKIVFLSLIPTFVIITSTGLSDINCLILKENVDGSKKSKLLLS